MRAEPDRRAPRPERAPFTSWEDVRPRTGRDESPPRFVGSREGRLAYHVVQADSGDGDAEVEAGKSGTPLLLLHGFTGHRDDFVGVMPFLARGRSVFAPDLRGHGDSTNAPGRAGFGFGQLVADLEALLDALELDRVDLLGHSVGGMIAIRFALAHPDRLRSLALMCTAPSCPARMDPKGWAVATALAEAKGIDELQRRATAAAYRDGFAGLAAWGDAERYFEHHRRRIRSMSPESYRGVGEAFFRSTSVEERLGEIHRPSLVLVGAQDHEWIPGFEAFAAGLPNVRAVVVPDAEHHPHQENPAVFFTELDAHLSRAAGAAR